MTSRGFSCAGAPAASYDSQVLPSEKLVPSAEETEAGFDLRYEPCFSDLRLISLRKPPRGPAG